MHQIGCYQRISSNFRNYMQISHMRDPPERDTSGFFFLWMTKRHGKSGAKDAAHIHD